MDRKHLMVAVDLTRILPALGMLVALRWHSPGLAITCVALGAAAEGVGRARASWGLAGVSLLYGAWWLWWARDLWRGRADVLTDSHPRQPG